MTRKIFEQISSFQGMQGVELSAAELALKGYTDKQIAEAYAYHLQNSPFPLKVCDIVEYWERKAGFDPAALKLTATEIYSKYFKHPETGCDYVCADPRVVYAFKLTFGSLLDYGRRTDYIEGIDKKEFVEAYVNADPRNYELAGNVIEGINHDNRPTVILIGDQEVARNIAHLEYGDNVKIRSDAQIERENLARLIAQRDDAKTDEMLSRHPQGGTGIESVEEAIKQMLEMTAKPRLA